MEKRLYKCFLIAPHDRQAQLATAIREISSVFDDFALEIVSAATSTVSRGLAENILASIASADLCIADLSSVNPNVLVEIGYAEGQGKPTVLIAQHIDQTPSGLKGRLVLQYEPTAEGFLSLGKRLAQLLPEVVKEVERGADKALIFQTLHDADLPARLRRAREVVDILQTNLTTVLANLLDPIIEATRTSPSLRVRILTLDPDSPFSIYRARQLATPFSSYRQELVGSLASVVARTGHLRSVELRIYDEFPTQILLPN